MKKRRWWALLALILTIIVRRQCGHDELTVATYNIEDYPKSVTQEVGAFAMIASLGASAIAVQEITDPVRFEKTAKSRLGSTWRFTYPKTFAGTHRIGVLYDSADFELLGTKVHRESERAGGKAAFEVRLEPARGGDPLRMIVVHLKAGADGVDTRLAQLRALRPVIVAARESGDRVVMLGDFNATSERDRAELAELSGAADLYWATKDLGCTSYWDRHDGCIGSALDHVLHGGGDPAEVHGPCEIEGCARHDRCPIYVDHVSDHCPVTVKIR